MSVVIDGTTGISGNDGSAATPALRGDDANTGVFFPAADTVAVATGGSERVRVNSSGNMGIGTDTPEAPLHVVGGDVIIEEANDGSATAPILIMRRTSTTPAADDYVGSITFQGVDDALASQTYARILAQATDVTAGAEDGALIFWTTGAGTSAERARIDNTGRVGIGTDTPENPLHVKSSLDTIAIFESTDSSSAIKVIDSNTTGGSDAEHGLNAVGDQLEVRAVGNIGFETNGVERARIDSAGNMGIGTDSPVSPLHVYLTDATTYGDGTAALDNTNLIIVQNGSQVNDTYSGIQLRSENAAGTVGWWSIASVSTSSNYDNHLVFHQRTGSATYAERARIDNNGGFLVACTSLSTTSSTDTGFSVGGSGTGTFARSGNFAIVAMRQTNDGTIISLRQAGVEEGTISVSGTTVSYNGGHLSRWAQFPDNSRPELLKGTVMSNLDQMSNWDQEDNEQLNCVEVSAVEGDANVAGVFVAWDSTDDGYNDILLAMTGDMVIRIAGGTTVQRGDLLMSAGDGTAKPQGDDIVRSKTIAKVTSTHVSHTYADGSYAVPCVLMAC